MGIDRGRYFALFYYLSSLLSLTRPFNQRSLIFSLHWISFYSGAVTSRKTQLLWKKRPRVLKDLSGGNRVHTAELRMPTFLEPISRCRTEMALIDSADRSLKCTAIATSSESLYLPRERPSPFKTIFNRLTSAALDA